MSWFEQWAQRRAARRYARLMPGLLARGWGRAGSYTPGQVAAVLRQIDPGGRHAAIAYAAFLTPEDFAAQDGALSGLSYDEARALFMRSRPSAARSWYAFEQSSGGEPASPD